MSSPILTLPQIPKNIDGELFDYLTNLTKILQMKQAEDFGQSQESEFKVKAENTAPAGDEWLFAQDPSDPFTVKKMSTGTLSDYITTSIKDKAENTAPAGDEWLFTQDPSDPFTVKKMSLETIRTYVAELSDNVISDNVIGSTIRTEATLIPISPTFPWLCLSYPSIDLTTANYSNEFIDALRARKYIYDEFGTNTSAFSGSWTSANVFTLANTTANKTMLAELAEDWLYHGSPLSNWRIINDGVTDFKMTTMNVTARTITVNLDGVSATGTSIIIYTNRVYRQATKARHFSEAGLATYQAGGGKSGRLFRRDQMQRITGKLDLIAADQAFIATAEGVFSASGNTGKRPADSRNATRYRYANFNSANSPDARTSATTDGETIAKSSSRYEYIYVGSYTA